LPSTTLAFARPLGSSDARQAVMRQAGCRIRYMGNKHALAAHVRALIDEQPTTPFIDLFCGMCSVAGSLSDTGRPVIRNDVQHYAPLAARCMLASPHDPPDGDRLRPSLKRRFDRNRRRLLQRFGDDVSREERILARSDARGYATAHEGWRHAGNDS